MTRGSITQTRTYVYNSAGELTSATNPESGTVTHTYNSDHTLQQKQDAKGQVTVYTYDSAKRVTEVQVYPYGTGSSEDACQRVIYGYDSGTNGLGRLTSTQYGASPFSFPCPGTPAWRLYQESYSYHAAGAVTGKTMSVFTPSPWWVGTPFQADISVAYTYDSAGRLSTTRVNGANITPSNGTFTNTYDGMGRLVSMADDNPTSFSGTGVTWVQNGQYDAAERMTGMQLFVGSSMASNPSSWSSMYQQTMGYNANGQLTSLHWETYLQPWAGHYSRDLQYSYSGTQNNGQIAQMTDGISGETVSYAYDALKRLRSASSSPISGSMPAAWAHTYAYDGFENLTGQTLNGTTTAIAVTSATNRLTNSSYDANGNMLTGVGATFTYDGRNRMFSATPISGGTEYYAYAPDNKRVYRWAADGTETWTFYGGRGERLCDFGLEWADTSHAPTIRAKNFNVWFGGKLIAKVNTWSDIVSMRRDRVGTDRETGARYYPYGEEITSTPNDTEKFATYFRDSFTTLDYADQRYYASTYGRFNTVDRGPANLGAPQTLNRYTYVGGDPVNSSDPSGLCAVDGNGNWWDGEPNGLWSPFPGRCKDNPSWLRMAGNGVYYEDQWYVYTVPPEPDPCWSPENAGGCGGGGGGDPITVSQDGSGGGGISNSDFGTAKLALLNAAHGIAEWFGSENVRPECEHDLIAVGVTNSQIVNFANHVNILNAWTDGSRIAYATAAFGNTRAHRPNRRAWGTTTVATYVLAHPGTAAIAQALGNNVYINSGYVNAFDATNQSGMLLHELLHNITGSVDSVLQAALHIVVGAPSQNIADQLIKDCY
jgi:RHS repeat-associated protein